MFRPLNNLKTDRFPFQKVFVERCELVLKRDWTECYGCCPYLYQGKCFWCIDVGDASDGGDDDGEDQVGGEEEDDEDEQRASLALITVFL